MFRRLFGRRDKTPANVASKPESAVTTRPVSTQPAPVVQDVTDADFETAVLQAEQLTIVDVWAEWCQPCETMSAYATWLAQEYAGKLMVVALDADENPQVPERYGIMGLPTLLFFRGGVEIDRQMGLLSYEALCAKVEAHLA